MILYYTGATAPDTIQINADKSLGGFVSSSVIPNGRLANLFSTIAKSDITGKVFDVRMIALKNITGGTVNNVKIYSVLGSSPHVKLKLAAVAPATNNCGNKYFESIYDSHTLPYQATLDYHEGSGNAIDAGSILNNDIVGIWIMREIDQTKFPELNAASNLTGKQLYDLLIANNNNVNENIQVVIDYTT
jgi:hypothetical protein